MHAGETMCGRYTLTVDQEALEAALQVPLLLQHVPRFNVAPTQDVPVVLRDADGSDTARALRWGLIPHWAEEAAIGARLINARAETVHRKPAFREAFRNGRCLVPADGFYEWRKTNGGKVPYWIHRGGGEIFTFAGVSARWTSPDGEELRTFSILTTEAPPELELLHPRVPVVMEAEDRRRWLDAATSDEELRALLHPPDGATFEVRPVGRRVNAPAHDDPECIAPIPDPFDDAGTTERPRG